VVVFLCCEKGQPQRVLAARDSAQDGKNQAIPINPEGMMKTAMSLMVIVLLLAASASAADNPVDKGSLTVGGSAFFWMQSGDAYENGDGDPYITIAFTPSLGYYVSPGLLIGGEFSFLRQSQGDYSRSDLTLGPVIGYYFGSDRLRAEAKGAVYPFIQGFFNYGHQSVDYGWMDGSASLIRFGGQFGVVMMVSNAVGLDLSIRAFSDTWSNGDSERGFNLMAGVGITSFIY
jgi:opacity protein-like surface antigen